MQETYKVIFTMLLAGAMLMSCKSKKEVTASTQEKSTVHATDATPKATEDAVEGLNLGNKAPEIVMNDPNGNPLKLSSLKGSVVLVDFWASWCGPCRHENPAVVDAARKYAKTEFKNGLGFKVFSVSLDQNKDAWVKAIEKDGLFWQYHVSDLNGWGNAAAVKYGVNSIPTNVLINADGIIIGKGLRGEALMNALANYTK